MPICWFSMKKTKISSDQPKSVVFSVELKNKNETKRERNKNELFKKKNKEEKKIKLIDGEKNEKYERHSNFSHVIFFSN